MTNPQGKELDFAIHIERPVVIVAARTSSGDFVVLRQFYAALERKMTTLIAGMVDEGLTPLQAAHKELREEAGYETPHMISLGATAKGKYITEMVYYFLADNAVSAGDQELEDAEDITVELVNKEEFEKLVREDGLGEGWSQLAGYKVLSHLEHC